MCCVDSTRPEGALLAREGHSLICHQASGKASINGGSGAVAAIRIAHGACWWR